ncbi:hypothetical protein GCM10011344_27070 [Dokdonia pacifica]|uniref:Uncharacterized protein n=1 Tax=Dokdonia pacifica TaxID=1627892 RepID=A0A239E6S3_9FLAO|nr:hypothetical protein [Dokdonia pacifica]GGG24998.1 hypothetical protein GCM10011344_27070 [Dokdonia pacifica]SNS40415.1 hypothetical protein SAMN06265376_11437 [Dokdonia pacifica]
MTKFYNVVTRKTINQDTIGKKIYHKVGILKVTENGGWFLQMYHQPNTDFMVFPNHNESLPVINFGNNEA